MSMFEEFVLQLGFVLGINPFEVRQLFSLSSWSKSDFSFRELFIPILLSAET